MIPKKLSKSAYKIEGQPMFKLLDKAQRMEAQGKDIIHFELGDPDFNTPENIIEATVSSLRGGDTHYVNSMGLQEMRLAVIEATLISRKFSPTLNQILVTPGANIIIYLAIKCLVNPGEEVIVPSPGFPTYFSVIKLCDVVPVEAPLREENNFRMNPKDIMEKITSKTKLIILNSPNNPTGSVMTSKEMNEIYEIAEKNGIYLLSDEVYSRMIYGDVKFYSPSFNDHCKERTILLNGFSKAFAMTGWRLGIAIGPEEVIEKMGLLVQTLCSCVPPFIQRGGVAALKEDQKEVHQMVKTYKDRRDIMVDGLNKIPKISCLKPDGAFYVFPNITKTGMNSTQFANFILERAGVALLPGSSFGKHGEGYVRLVYASDAEKIKEGLARIKRALES